MRAFLITSPEYYTHNTTTFREKLFYVLEQHKPYAAIYRDKENPNYKALAEIFLEVCHELGVKAYLHADVALASSLKADGVHLTSSQFDAIKKAREAGLLCGISAHTIDDLKRAELLGANYATYSPIFASPNKGEPKGIEALKEAVERTYMPVVALGGIVEAWHVEEVAKTGAYGFAAIRYFYI